MKLGIVMPVVLQNETLLNVTRDAVAHLKTRHQAVLYVICNRLSLLSVTRLESELQSWFRGRVVVLWDRERSVAGAWNKGCELAMADSNDYLTIVANDTRLREDCLDQLVQFGEQGGADLWSGIANNACTEIDRHGVTEGADFTCFMFRPWIIQRHGWFDPNYRPAYFEDNDYYGRVVLGGGRCRVVQAAQFFHHGSRTIREDAEMAHHVSWWFGINRAYFARKWGVPQPENHVEGVLRTYYRHPFNDSSKALSWFPRES